MSFWLKVSVEAHFCLRRCSKTLFHFTEYRYLIMKKAFELAIRGNTSALAKVNESFIALKSQLGC